MEWKGRVLVQLLMLVCVLEVSLCQHWSYGWLPGGKRSVGEVEATIRMMDGGDTLLSIPADTPMEQLSPIHIMNEVDAEGFPLKEQRFPNRRGRM
uniref:Progonadoliberin-3 n=1 Tax=Rutilus rutilus TaxID=48668 RepID=GON3_RUTRU|nr:RecName: Full=Progonadoliberin-3; AltName: Full=Progonadoliberin III; Contains: RecName: Full=Gonadoliberin-3; AltName: Full=Gonadoliberin III; AltName: Full=Gonadotropin-releasing hormone III; Short=GnRH III; AltName: Full=Luliberin III; AltName: Full=Luteinizing hormone-releasing hormone III; Short=LH-RH III; Contains: RecName: Full=GnRH-associated peptide 3; AltName: Full=GnRH-associated peptide III; Flags: Precursor [Rutilus rutilus]AAB65821.1 salmon-type gonadotrophic-releasing hormone pre